MSLGEQFPDEFKRQFSERQITVGSVIKCMTDQTDPPKEKRFIIVGISNDNIAVGSVFINSELNISINWSQRFKDLQIPLESHSREYLEWDSYVDCARLYEWTYQELQTILESDPGTVIGELDSNDQALIIGSLKSATTISPKKKRKFGLI